MIRLLVARDAMHSVRKVHTLGIMQNTPLELHHFVMKDGKVLLVDFTQALPHRCNNAMPLYINREPEDARDADEYDCGELMMIAKQSLCAAAVRC